MEISELEIVGPVGIRRFSGEHKCEAFVGHEHNYDHATTVVKGRMQVSCSAVRDGVLVDLGSAEYEPGDVIHMPAKVRHTIKPLDDHWLFICTFSHMDFGGLVSEVYVGNQAAYL